MKQDDLKTDKLYKALQQYPKKRIGLDELKTLCGFSENYRDQILVLAEAGVLQAVKNSGTDGNLQKPLYLRYTIRLEEETPDTEEIYTLHPRLTANGYLLKKPKEYFRHKQFLLCLSKWLSTSVKSTQMSRRERSFEIFGDEKMLDKHVSFLESIAVSGQTLCYYETPDQCFADYIPIRKAEMTLLICENKDIWFNIRRLMYEQGLWVLFGVPIDGVIFGQGNDITGKSKFLSYSHFLGAERVKYLYCGDIDRAGFDIFLRLCKEAEELQISLFVPAYRKMLELAGTRDLPDSDDARNLLPDMTEVLPMFKVQEQQQIMRILQERKRLPQEILSFPILMDHMSR